MQIAFIPAFFLIAVIIIMPYYYADAELTINDFTTSYAVGDTIPITGTLDIPSEVSIQVITPNGNLATVRQLSAETQFFAINITSGGPLFSQTGLYTIYASDTYAGIDHTTFTLTTRPGITTSAQSPSAIYGDDNNNQKEGVLSSSSQEGDSVNSIPAASNNTPTPTSQAGTSSSSFSSTLDLNFVSLLAIVAIVVISLTMAAVIVTVGLNNGQFYGHTGSGEHNIDGLTESINKKEEVRRI